jgi:hypothetical protein
MVFDMITHNPDTLLQRPWRGPIEVPEVLREYYEGKTVVEIGCAAGDYMPIWSKYAKHYTGYELRGDWYSLAAGRSDIGDNVTLLNERVTPENIAEADLYYSWSPEPGIEEFVGRMQAAGKTGIFAMYSGVSVEDIVEDVTQGAPYGRPVNGESDTCTHPLSWGDYPTKLIPFQASELDNRGFFDEYATGRRCQVMIKLIG